MLIFILILLSTQQITCLEVPRGNRAAPLEDIIQGSILHQETPLKTKQVRNQRHCIHLCYQTTDCRSYNLCGGKICQLNKEDRFVHKTQMNASERCFYAGMKQNDQPTCEQKGKYQPITDDITPGLCMINNKRVDVECFRATVEETYKEVAGPGFEYSIQWMKISRIHSWPAAHGGKDSCSTQTDIVLENYIWIRKAQSYDEHIAQCATKGGKIFGDFDGTQDQIDFYAKHMPTRFFVGAKKGKVFNQHF
ncbi:uncharacterized protein LOC142346117 [Convolutriloba macropyga]|uniref:uncharacterized protein LOC142346117 n=1 Tax=Convolutriloba macropyga TaxID=536237 RepID=UPI003F520A4F